MAGGVPGYLTADGSVGGKKCKVETPRVGGGWYRFYGNFPVYQTGPRSGQAVLHLHPSLDLLHRRPIRKGVQVPKRRLTVHMVILLEPV